MIDTHCHLTYDGLHERLDAVLSAAKAAGVDRMITIGTTPPDSGKAYSIAAQYKNVYFAAGLHPHYSRDWREVDVQSAINVLCVDPKCVAIGEMGLDRHYPEPPIEDQKKMFAVQLDLIKELDLRDEVVPFPIHVPSEPWNVRAPTPAKVGGKAIIIHNREATDETIGMIRDSGIAGDRFVFHCFTGSSEELDKILDLGAMVSFTGIVTFTTAAQLARDAARVPGDRIMIETDSPYLAPEPYRKVRPNEPKYVADVARFLAKARGESEGDFVARVDANAVRFFGLK